MFTSETEPWLSDSLLGNWYTPIEQKEISEYVSQVGKNLVKYSIEPTRSFEFTVIDGSDPDAFTPGSGRVFITVGLLKQLESEDELAGILAHEMGHDAMRHVPKTMTRKFFWMMGVNKARSPEDVEKNVWRLFEKYHRQPVAGFFEALSGISRFDELDADRCAFYTTFRAGYNPQGVVAALKRLEKEVKEGMSKDDYTMYQFYLFWLGSHPPTGQRAGALDWERKFVKSLPPKETKYFSPCFEVVKARLNQAN